MNKDGKRTDPLPPANCIQAVTLQPQAGLVFGKAGDDGDFKRSEHVCGGPPVGRAQQVIGCLGDRHREIQCPARYPALR